MKTIITMLVLISVVLTIHADDTPLIPDPVNKILGQLKPDMPETEVEKIVKKYYPDSTEKHGPWSGSTGYVEFRISDRYSVSISEYNDQKDLELRFVHSSMTFYVYDWELKKRINLSVYDWDKNQNKNPNQRLEPIVKTPVDEVEAQGTQAHP